MKKKWLLSSLLAWSCYVGPLVHADEVIVDESITTSEIEVVSIEDESLVEDEIIVVEDEEDSVPAPQKLQMKRR